MGLTPEQRSGIFFENIEGNDCSVVAIQAATGLERGAARELAVRVGYSDSGMPYGYTSRAVRAAGYKTREIPVDRRFETPATFSLTHENGTYILYTPGHVAALVDGDLHNSRSSWSKPLLKVDEVLS